MIEEQKAKLKRDITKRWEGIKCGDTTSFAQLEYILQEAGLLARPRRRLARIKNLEAAITA